TAVRTRADEVAEDAVEACHADVRVELRVREIRVGDAEELEHQREVVAEPFVEEEQAARDLLPRGDRTVAFIDAEVSAQQLQDGQEGERASMWESVRFEHTHAGRSHALHE